MIPHDILYYLRLPWKMFLCQAICHLYARGLLIFLGSFYIQIFCWKFFVNSRSLWWIFKGHLCILSNLLQIKLFWDIPFQSVFPWSSVVLLLWPRLRRTILNKHGKSGQPCLIPHFRAVTLSCSPFKLILVTGLL